MCAIQEFSLRRSLWLLVPGRGSRCNILRAQAGVQGLPGRIHSSPRAETSQNIWILTCDVSQQAWTQLGHQANFWAGPKQNAPFQFKVDALPFCQALSSLMCFSLATPSSPFSLILLLFFSPILMTKGSQNLCQNPKFVFSARNSFLGRFFNFTDAATIWNQIWFRWWSSCLCERNVQRRNRRLTLNCGDKSVIEWEGPVVLIRKESRIRKTRIIWVLDPPLVTLALCTHLRLELNYSIPLELVDAGNPNSEVH